MDLEVDGLAKKYGSQWVFKALNFNLPSGQILGVKGRNGSGKSTLLNIILGTVLPTKGKVSFSENGKKVSQDDIISKINISGPYTALPNELTGPELIDTVSQFRRVDSSAEQIMEYALLGGQLKKPIHQYSTGMLQRLKLSLAFFVESDIVILDEPTSNLDDQGKQWYLDLVKEKLKGRSAIIASNETQDFFHCNQSLVVTDFHS